MNKMAADMHPKMSSAAKKCKREEVGKGSAELLKNLECFARKGSADEACGVVQSVDLQSAVVLLLTDKPDKLPASLLHSGPAEMDGLRRYFERVVVVWLADVPCSSAEEVGRLKESVGQDTPTLDFSLAFPSHCVAPSDAFLSADLLEPALFPDGRREWRACCRTELLMAVKEMEKRGYPVPFSSEVKSDHDWSIKFGKLIHTFQWSGHTFVTRHKSFTDCPKLTESAPLFSLDCEMVQTAMDNMALGRVSIVNEEMECIYDTFVKPREPILDYMTKYSGITARHLEGVTTTVEDVQKELLRLLPADAILVGQSLESDLRALRYAHPYIIDTSVIFTSSSKRHTPSLAFLAKHLLNVNLKRGKTGHNSEDDARVAMKLVQAKLSIGHELMVGPAGVASLFQVFSDFGVRSVMIDNTRYIKLYAVGNTHADKAENDHRALWCTRRLSECRFGWVQFHSYQLASQNGDGKKKAVPSTKLSQLANAVQSVVGSVPAKSVVFVVLGGRDTTVVELGAMHCKVVTFYKP